MTPWTVDHQAPLPMGFSRQELWNGLPFPTPRNLPDPGIKPTCLALKADSLPLRNWEGFIKYFIYIDMYIHFLQVGLRAWLLEVMAPESVCLDFSPDSAICFLCALGLLILPQGQDFLTV